MDKKSKGDLLPGTLEMLILQTLKRGPLHGYAIADYIQRTSEDVLQVEEGSLYPALQRLLREKFVMAEWGLSARNRNVRIYTLTEAGRLLRALLYQVTPNDPGALVTAVFAFALAALAGCYLPARRASTVDPALALRQES